MSDDMVKRGNALAHHMRECRTHDDVDAETAQEMATRIQELEAEVERLRGSLTLIANAIDAGRVENEDPNHRIKLHGDDNRFEDGYLVGTTANKLRDAFVGLRDIARQSLGDSND